LKEETNIKVPAQVRRGRVKTSRTFDNPNFFRILKQTLPRRQRDFMTLNQKIGQGVNAMTKYSHCVPFLCVDKKVENI
jgi:hypothetical protein